MVEGNLYKINNKINYNNKNYNIYKNNKNNNYVNNKNKETYIVNNNKNLTTNLSKENLYAYNYYEEYKEQGIELRKNQMMPANPEEWYVWLISAGRGFGKTISGAAAIDTLVRNGAFKNIGIIGATVQDARHIMCENGLKKVNPNIKILANKQKVIWENGTVGHFLGGDIPYKLRGHEFDLIWIDEFVKLRNPEELWEQINFCLRGKGADNTSKIIITTTPNNKKILETIAYDPYTVITHGSSYDNKKNLSSRFFHNIETYKNTSFGEQEIYGKIINDNHLWRPFHIKHLHKNNDNNPVFFETNYDNFLRDAENINTENMTKEEILEAMYGRVQEDKNDKISELDSDIIARINKINFDDIAPIIDEYTIGVDPAFGGRSETGIILLGVTKNNQYYVLEDLSGNYSCSVWTRIVRFLSKKFSRCSISIETNHGGDIFKEIFSGHMYIKENRASESKFKRSISSLIMYENSEVIHYKPFKNLESQMLNFRPNKNDRVDALVWALKFLKSRYSPNYWVDDEFKNKEETNNLADENNIKNFNLISDNNEKTHKNNNEEIPVQENFDVLKIFENKNPKIISLNKNQNSENIQDNKSNERRSHVKNNISNIKKNINKTKKRSKNEFKINDKSHKNKINNINDSSGEPNSLMENLPPINNIKINKKHQQHHIHKSVKNLIKKKEGP